MNQSNPNGRLAGRIALVTGASRGIGRAVSIKFALEGATLIAVSRTKKDLLTLDDEIKSLTDTRIIIVDEDVTNYDSVQKISRAVFARFKKLDILVGGAAILGPLSPISHITKNDWEQVLKTNLSANWYLMSLLDPLLRSSKAGRAIFLTCAQGIKPSPFWGAYSASKAALENLVNIYADELIESNVRVNLIDPGPINTALRRKAYPGEDTKNQLTADEITEHFVKLAEETYELTRQRITL
jgi:NAD(P)-dependent dehydrogenase (short-subunit alcohol dehydrogenase family)